MTDDDRGERVRVVTWNIWWSFGEQWRERHVAIRRTLEELAPDVVGLQEVWGTADSSVHQAQELADALGMHATFATPSLPAPPPDAAGQEVGVGVLSRWPIERTEMHRLPSSHRKEVVILAAEIRHPLGPLHTLVTCADYTEGAGAQRLAQTTALADLAHDPSRDGRLPVLAMGDLNASPETPEIRAIADRMTDTWVAANGEDAPGLTIRSDNPYRAEGGGWQIDRRIDYVFARPGADDTPLIVTSARAIDEPRDGIHPSDHACVVVDLELRLPV
jgi:endonuclease/exonuclease/phosphatase family metal-dependent hydrolase